MNRAGLVSVGCPGYTLRGPFPYVPELLPIPHGKRAAQNATTKNQAIAKTRRTELAKAQRWFQLKPTETAPRLVGSITDVAKHHKAAAAYAVWTVVEWHSAAGRRDEADAVAKLALTYGYRDPREMNWHLSRLSGARRPGDIATALTICDTVLASRHGSTDHGWLLITSRRANLAGIADRASAATQTVLDADGNPVRKRRHHPENPPRTATLRFARDPTTPSPASPASGCCSAKPPAPTRPPPRSSSPTPQQARPPSDRSPACSGSTPPAAPHGARDPG